MRVNKNLDKQIDLLKIDNTKLKVSTGHLANIGKGTRARKAMITFSTDDGRQEDWTIYKDLFAEYEIGFTTAIIRKVTSESLTRWTGATGTFCTLNEMLTLQNQYGCEIVNHGDSSHLKTLSDADLDKELRETREWMIEKGFKGYDYFMIPFGEYDERVKRFIAKYYKGCRTTQDSMTKIPMASYELGWKELTNSTTVDAQTGFARNTIEHWRALIDIAIAEGRWLILGTHSWEVAQNNLTNLLEQIIQYAIEKRNAGTLDIVNYQEAFERHGNIIDSAAYDRNKFRCYTRVSADGQFESNVAKTVLLETNSIRFTATPADIAEIKYATENGKIPQDYISICPITLAHPDITSFPEGKGGTLYTYCFAPSDNYTDLSNRLYFKQEYKMYNSNKVYTRSPNNSTTWKTFQLEGFESGCWNGVVAMSTTATKIGHDNNIVTNIVEFEQVFAITNGTTSPTLSKTIWKASELSTDSANPTIIGTVGAINLLCYLGTTKNPVLKYSATGNNGDVYFRIHTC